MKYHLANINLNDTYQQVYEIFITLYLPKTNPWFTLILISMDAIL